MNNIHNHTGHVLTERGLLLAQSFLVQIREMRIESSQVTLEASARGGPSYRFVATLTSAGLLK